MLTKLVGTLFLLLWSALPALSLTALAGPPGETPVVASLFGPSAPAALRGPHAAPARPAMRHVERPTDYFPEIDRVGAAIWTVEQSLVDEYAGDFDRIEALARARRHRATSGEIDGYYIDRIRWDNPLYDAGIRNGDVVHSVNGDPTRSSVQVLRAFYRHRHAKLLRVELTRRGGARMTLTYLIG